MRHSTLVPRDPWLSLRCTDLTRLCPPSSPQVLSSEQEPFQCGEPSPFPAEGGEQAALAYKYRSFPLGEQHTLVVRCDVDAVMQYKGSDQLLSIKALNEFDPKCAAPPSHPL